MRFIQCHVAETRRELDDAVRIRWEVLGEELHLLPAAPAAPREVDAFDTLQTTLHFVAYADGQPAATARLLLPNPEVARLHGCSLGLDLESRFDLHDLLGWGLTLAEATRFCVLAPFRRTRAVDELARAMRDESRRRGITHWVAGVNTETDCPDDASTVYRLAARLGLVSARFRVAPLAGTVPSARPCFPIYTPEQRARALAGDFTGLRLPRPLLVFARRLGARFTGTPRYDTRFQRFAMPIVAAVEPGALAEPWSNRATGPISFGS